MPRPLPSPSPPSYVPDECGSLIPCGPPELGGNCPTGEVCSPDQQCIKPPDPCTPETQVGRRGLHLAGAPARGGWRPAQAAPQRGGAARRHSCPAVGSVGLVHCLPPSPGSKPVSGHALPACPAQCAPGKVCGTQDDGCGGTIPCGNCPGGQFCAPDGLSCIPECVPKTECDDKYKCGTQVRTDGVMPGGGAHANATATQCCHARLGSCPGWTGMARCVPPADPGVPSHATPRPPPPRRLTQPNGCGGQIPCGICPANYSCTPDAGTGGSICEPDPCVSDGQCPPTFVCGPAVRGGGGRAIRPQGHALSAGAARAPERGLPGCAARTPGCLLKPRMSPLWPPRSRAPGLPASPRPRSAVCRRHGKRTRAS